MYPNTKPVRIGNSSFELDLHVLTPGIQNDVSSPEDIEPIKLMRWTMVARRVKWKFSIALKQCMASVAWLEEDTMATVTKPKKS